MQRIAKRLGPQHAKAALEALASADLASVARITLGYYDKAYAHGLAQREASTVHRIEALPTDLRALAQRLQEHAAATAPITR